MNHQGICDKVIGHIRLIRFVEGQKGHDTNHILLSIGHIHS